MGNCHAVEVESLVIEYPSGKTKRMYRSISASEVMKLNPGHYVSIIIPMSSDNDHIREEKSVQFTRVKLLRSSETLVIGQAYRLVTTEEFMKALKEKSYERMRRSRRYSDNESRMDHVKDSSSDLDSEKMDMRKISQSMRHERYGQIPTQAKFTRSRSWCPSLQSIAEGGSWK